MPRDVLHFTPFAGQLSGAQRSMLTLAVAQQARGDRPRILLLHEGAVADAARHEKLPLHFCGIPPSPADIRLPHRARLTARLLKLRRQVPGGILHCHSAHGIKFLWPSALWAGWRLVGHQRDEYQRDTFHAGLDRLSNIIAISAWVRDQLPPVLHRRTTVIHNAQAIPPGSMLPPPLSTPRPRIGFAGRCVPAKGIDLFLDASLELMQRHDCEVHVWGLARQGDPEQVRHSAALEARIAGLPGSLRERVTLQAFRNDVREFYRGMDVVVVPSRSPEPFGRVAIEAMSYGRVVIGSRQGGLAEILRHGVNGLLFEPGSVASLVVCLERVLTSPGEAARLGEGAFSDVQERFSPEAHARAVEEVYRVAERRALWRSVLDGWRPLPSG